MISPKPSLVIACFLVFLALLAVFGSVLGLTAPVMKLDETRIFYLFSTSAQVLAAIYGLTLTGFVFFRNELSREEFEDGTLADVVEGLKKRYFAILMFVTALVFTTLLLSNLSISFGEGDSKVFQTILINGTQSSYFVSLLAIMYFIVDVMSPKRIEAISKQQRDQMDPDYTAMTKGSLEDFLRNYNQIESILDEHGKPFQSGIASMAPRRRIISNAKVAEYLYRNEKISKSTYSKVRELITLRNSIIHGAEPVVSSDLVRKSAEVLRELREAVEDQRDDLP